MKQLEAFFGGRFHLYVFFITLISSICLLTVGFILPPPGEIPPSVIAAVGELMGFAALGEVGAALERGTKAKVTHKDTTVEIGNDNNAEHDYS